MGVYNKLDEHLCEVDVIIAGGMFANYSIIPKQHYSRI